MIHINDMDIKMQKDKQLRPRHCHPLKKIHTKFQLLLLNLEESYTTNKHEKLKISTKKTQLWCCDTSAIGLKSQKPRIKNVWSSFQLDMEGSYMRNIFKISEKQTKKPHIQGYEGVKWDQKVETTKRYIYGHQQLYLENFSNSLI